MLLAYGYTNIRCLVRASSRLDDLRAVILEAKSGSCVEIVAGDLVSRDTCQMATEGASLVYHLAAGMDKSFAGAFMTSAVGTRNLVESFLTNASPRRFVNVSSFAVYSNATIPRGAPMDESCPLEDSHQARNDAYGFGKLKQEEVVKQYGSTRGLPYVILRPGTVFGPGKRSLSGRIGVDTFGFLIHIGRNNLLPLTFVDNCAEAVVLAGLIPGVEGEILNVVDDQLLTSAQFLKAYRDRVGPMSAVPMPYFMAYALSALWERYSIYSQGQLPPAFNRRRCMAEWKGNKFPNQKIKQVLGWRPRVGMDEAMRRFLGQFPDKDSKGCSE